MTTEKRSSKWWDVAWNPTTGCSPEFQCWERCWARRMAKRSGDKYFIPQDHPERFDKPIHWKKPRRIFVCNMGDLFVNDVPFPWIARVWDTIFDTPWHTYFILTKRPDRMREFKRWMEFTQKRNIIYENVWLGVSVSDQPSADVRIPELLNIEGFKKFVSYEPALGPVNFISKWTPMVNYVETITKIDWVIAGCESGPGRRAADPEWFRSVRHQCQQAGVPYFLKQMDVNGKLVHMSELDGKVWDERPTS